jgi:hypothetical protein
LIDKQTDWLKIGALSSDWLKVGVINIYEKLEWSADDGTALIFP